MPNHMGLPREYDFSPIFSAADIFDFHGDENNKTAPAQLPTSTPKDLFEQILKELSINTLDHILCLILG